MTAESPNEVPGAATEVHAAASISRTVVLDASDIVTTYRVSRQAVRHSPSRSSVLRAVDGVSLSVNRGETVALIGESGSGKSTLGRTLTRLERPAEGSVIFDGRDITRTRGRDLRKLRGSMSLIFQDAYAAMNPRHRLITSMCEPLVAHGRYDPSERLRLAHEICDRVGLPQRVRNSYPHEVSGGQLQRAVIARALITKPRFVVADEPTASLDVSIRAQVVNLLAELQNEQHLSLLFVSHDLRTVAHVADRIAVMYLGKIVELGTAEALTADPQHPYTRGLIQSLPGFRARNTTRRRLTMAEVPNALDPPPGCRFHPRCPIAVERCRSEAPHLEVKISGALVACHEVT